MQLLAYIRTKIGVFLVGLIRAKHGVVIFYGDEERRKRLDLITAVKRERKLLLSDHEAMELVMAVERTRKIPGDIAEVGTYKGVSAKLIAEARGNASGKTLHLFDTFAGLPDLQDIDRSHFSDKQFVAGEAEVAAYLSAYPDVRLYAGKFPDTSGPIEQKRFSLVHLDVDLYQSTKDSIEFFYPRMSQGGVIISHDYMTAPGVRKAIDEYMADKPEAVFEASWRQCFIVKASVI